MANLSNNFSEVNYVVVELRAQDLPQYEHCKGQKFYLAYDRKNRAWFGTVSRQTAERFLNKDQALLNFNDPIVQAALDFCGHDTTYANVVKA
jgi:hypothetical protein